MIIGIDGNEANIINRVGINVYAWELLTHLDKINKKSAHPIEFRIYLRDKPLLDMPSEHENWKYRVLPGGGKWVISKLSPDLFKFSPKPDIFFSPNHYVPPVCPCPRVCSIMDLGFLESSGQFKKRDYWQLRLWTAYSVLVSNHIIAISHATQKDIVRHYRFAKNKTTNILLAPESEYFTKVIQEKDVRRVKNKYSIVSDYALFLSTLKPSKNIEGLLAAWKEVLIDFPKLTLVVAGKKGWLYEHIFTLVKKLDIEDSVVFTDYVPQVDKAPLIGGARLFVLPSFWEGFGLDPLNAMSLGVPVVVSSKGSLPEVVGEAGELVDPESTDSIASGIKKILSLPQSEYNKRSKEGIKHAQTFSWEKTASKTLELLLKAKK
jgi:glycosyltransferase involved in cell wall biosynthesis